jgi:hypothetical protein
MNRIGYSSRLGYDGPCSYKDKLQESTGPLDYMLDANSTFNCSGCLSTLGPRSGYRGFGVSTPVTNRPGLSQSPEITDIESLLTNRNVKMSKCKKDEVNPIDVTKFKLKNPKVCNKFLDPMSSRLSYPPANYRDVGIDRFYNLNKNPQAHIFWPWEENTVLTLLDNFHDEIPEVWDIDPSLPKAYRGDPKFKTTKPYPVYTGYKM